jgi:hypothetical protein
MGPRLPSFFIIGAMKSATSTLHNQLAVQANIFMSTPKEPNFFSDDAMYAQGIDWYQGLFASAQEGDICGESSTHYSKLPDHPKTIARLQLLIQQPKIIYIMRHPIERLVSHYIHLWSESLVSGDINLAIDNCPQLVNYSCYGRQLMPYLDAFGAGSVLPIFFDALKYQPAETLVRVGEFIGAPAPLLWDHRLLADNVSQQRIRKFPGYRLLIESQLMTSLRRQLVPQRWRDGLKSRLRMRQRPLIDPVQRQKLVQIFDQDLAMLGEWLGFYPTCDQFYPLNDIDTDLDTESQPSA